MNSYGNDTSFVGVSGSTLSFGVVAIGRNEGERLRVCLDSLTAARIVIYVDSGSTDGSVQMARSRGIDVVELDQSIPFRNQRGRGTAMSNEKS